MTSGETRGWSRWLGNTTSALNLVFLVGFPIAFLGRIEGGFPEFVYGVPVAARALLLVLPVSGVMALAALLAVIVDFRTPRTSPSRFGLCRGRGLAIVRRVCVVLEPDAAGAGMRVSRTGIEPPEALHSRP